MVVIKLGGILSKKLVSEIKKIKNVLIVHGGGEMIDEHLKRQNIEPKFIKGLRYTDKKTLQIVRKVLNDINNKITRELRKNLVNAKSVEGTKILICKRIRKLGYVGKPFKVNKSYLQNILYKCIVPVISPVSRGDGKILNVNADDVASAVAIALKAEKLFFLIDKEGVLDRNKNLLTKINFRDIRTFIKNGIITGGMIPKIRAAAKAVKNNVKEVWIISEKSSLISPHGTRIFM